MDLLKAEMERKRKSVEIAKRSSDVEKVIPTHRKKRQYMRTADLRRFEERQREQEENPQDVSSTLPDPVVSPTSTKEKNTPSDKSENRTVTRDETSATAPENGDDTTESQPQSPKSKKEKKGKKARSVSPGEVTNELRLIGLPVRLFGERTVLIDKSKNLYDDSQREERLKAAIELMQKARAGMNEMDEFRLGRGHGIRNPFLGGKKVLKETNAVTVITDSAQESNKESLPANDPDTSDITDDPHKRIHRFFKSLLKVWEEDLTSRPEAQTRTNQGKNETKTLKQCKDYIRPLFKLCKNRKLESTIFDKILIIVNSCEAGEFVTANDAYMDVAIGRAAWPIGVTMVGIHARSGRAKIESSNVAHVMNSELQRKYLTSVKRLMSYCQKKRMDVAPSKKVLY